MPNRILDQKSLVLHIRAADSNCSRIDDLALPLELLRDNIWKCDGRVWKYADKHPENSALDVINTVYLLYFDRMFQLDIMLCGGIFSSMAQPDDILQFPTGPLESHYCCGIAMSTNIDATVIPYN